MMQAFYLLFQDRNHYLTTTKNLGLLIEAPTAEGETDWFPAFGYAISEVGPDQDGKWMVNVLASVLPDGLPVIDSPANPRQRFAGY